MKSLATHNTYITNLDLESPFESASEESSERSNNGSKDGYKESVKQEWVQGHGFLHFQLKR